MAKRVAVVGAGAAGTAAAWLLSRHAVDVTLLGAWSGSSALYSGVLDAAAPPDADTLAFAEALGIWNIAAGRGLRVATSSAVLRGCQGADSALLDCEPLAGCSIGVVDVARSDWDGVLLSRALGGDAWAKRTGTRFVPEPVELLHDPAEQRIGAYDFGRLFDSAARIDALCAAIAHAPRHDAWLLGPWLGLEAGSLARLRQRLQVPLGETTSAPGGLAGARFELGRARLLAHLGVSPIRALVRGLVCRSEQVELDVVPEQGDGYRLEVDQVILALGGVAGGGIRLALGLAESGVARPFELSVEAALPLALDGRMLDDVASLFGVDLTLSGLAALERVGLFTQAQRVLGHDRVFAAGDVVSGRERTMLEAIRAGCAAARAVLGTPAPISGE